MDSIWAVNPELSKLFCFEDGNCFSDEQAAKNHKRMTGKEYSIVEKEQEVKPKPQKVK